MGYLMLNQLWRWSETNDKHKDKRIRPNSEEADLNLIFTLNYQLGYSGLMIKILNSIN